MQGGALAAIRTVSPQMAYPLADLSPQGAMGDTTPTLSSAHTPRASDSAFRLAYRPA
jgi:hypothetical protein